ncbi:uncharacterized protein LOC131233497 [Magnolia sinica]|uniref:uncharacterized protein LOC131233497 n=1 Tax=Magnolia sinica TaxID=86752 RepID=UPI0026580AF0|nr:uncharacterized protein LOC131233497 [Magnolia sinica]
MGKLFEGSVLDPLPPLSPLTLSNLSKSQEIPFQTDDGSPEEQLKDWETVSGLQASQRRVLKTLSSRGVFWKHPSKPIAELFLLFHGGDVGADGNCLFSSASRALRFEGSPSDLRRRVVERFSEDYDAGVFPKGETDVTIRNLYRPDLELGWGVHFVQEMKILARKRDRENLDASINDLVRVGLSRVAAAESVYKERCISVENGDSWAKYMSITGNTDDEYDIVSLHYTEEGLLSVDENRNGRAAAFGDDIAIETLATEFQREIFVVQVHGSDATLDEEAMLFFLPHQPRGQITGPPIFLFMRGTGWCGAGADHYEPLIARAAPIVSKEKAVVVL